MKRKEYSLESLNELNLTACVDEETNKISYTVDADKLLEIGPQVLFSFTVLTLHTELCHSEKTGESEKWSHPKECKFSSKKPHGFTGYDLLRCVIDADRKQRLVSSSWSVDGIDASHVFFEGFFTMFKSEACTDFRMIWGS